MRQLTLFLTITLLVLASVARTKTTQPNLRTQHIVVEPIAMAAADSLATGQSLPDQTLVTLRGFNKRKSDARESFLITNHATHRMSNPRLTFRYTSMDGGMIHERTVTVPVTLNPGETRLAEVKTFDVQHLFYYYAGPVPRKTATPFKVAFRLVGYDIPVGL